jgi:hypothetical protein
MADADELFERAVTAACSVLVDVARADVAEAMRAAEAVYEADREQYVQDQLDQARLAGMNPTGKGMELNVVIARETAAHLVMAAKTYLDTTGAENYLEQTVYDRETGERYVIIFQRPGKKSPHELRQQAEAERDQARAQLDQIREERTHSCDGFCTEGGCDFDLGGFVDRVDTILAAAAEAAGNHNEKG